MIHVIWWLSGKCSAHLDDNQIKLINDTEVCSVIQPIQISLPFVVRPHGFLSNIANAGFVDFYSPVFWFDIALNWPDSYNYSKTLLSNPVWMRNEIMQRKNNYYANPKICFGETVKVINLLLHGPCNGPWKSENIVRYAVQVADVWLFHIDFSPVHHRMKSKRYTNWI